MWYDAELSFVQSYLKYSHIQCLLITEECTSIEHIDFGLRKMVGLQAEYDHLLEFMKENISPNRIYRIVDCFFCNFFLIPLPDSTPNTVMLIGPFLMNNPLKSTLLEMGELLAVPPQVFPFFENFFSSIPTLTDDVPILTLLHTLGERIWGDANNFSMEIFERGFEDYYNPTTVISSFSDVDIPTFGMDALENRYGIERDLMLAVSQGQIHKAEIFMNGMTSGSMEQRNPDSLRNYKNYSIIMNTLLRKAAEQGAVHPYYIDRLSSDFGRKIELAASIDACNKLHKEMIRKYCLLVKNHSMKGYSLLIQKVITQIDSDLTADLSLHALAKEQNINPSYLSAQFKKETGSTLTDYVNRKKIEHAILLLNSTSLQIQTIALYCGVPDVNYFTKLFKKYIHKTPKEYRDSITAMPL